MCVSVTDSDDKDQIKKFKTYEICFAIKKIQKPKPKTCESEKHAMTI